MFYDNIWQVLYCVNIHKHDGTNDLYVVLMESVLTTPSTCIVLLQFVLMMLNILFTWNNAVISTTAVRGLLYSIKFWSLVRKM
jgi:hypothetical protein